MDLKDQVRVTLECDFSTQIKAAISSFLQGRRDELHALIDGEVKAFDFDGEVKRAVRDELCRQASMEAQRIVAGARERIEEALAVIASGGGR